MKNFRKSRKALSPVVASIILIAVTVAVSIAVAAWMGALVVGNMNTEELKITNADFATSPGDVILSVRNTGSSAVILSDAYVGSTDETANAVGLGTSIAPNAVVTVTITPTTAFVDGQSYQFKLISTKGNAFVYTGTAPL